jgi:hypothetical protein
MFEIPFSLELINAVEQVILEEYYELEIEMNFKWKALPPAIGDDDVVDDVLVA